MSRHALLALLSFVIAMSAAGPGSSTLAQTNSAEEALVKKARAIHEKVITLDTHIDFSPGDLVGERNYTQRLETQFNLPNMIDGGLDALFFSIYVGQTQRSAESGCIQSRGLRARLQARRSKNSTRFIASLVRSRLTRSNWR